ncbi:MAG: hypothetical protein L3K04_05215 [Thermoplasmata archaeon]|nr:hypothetical protein [Thermoplasmata archaeon]MCI4342235.1 hypothetical protein [Thermoplasmata archaeon]
MTDPPELLAARIAKLEQDLQSLGDRVRALEQEGRRRAERRVDQSAVRGKVTYDWQS